ncbi:MAG: GerAB/ArcD/ProY family transporter [Eubacteriales bacterium]|nr:GerAB/ArcD/ProY family transporter [Eubacteriales bacterium]
MLAGNGKITDRQFCRLLIMDWFAKGALLLPALAGAVPVRSFILSLILGFLLALLYVRLLCGISAKVTGSFAQYLTEHLGKWALAGISVLFLVYAFVNVMYLTRAFAEIGVLFVVPESSRELLMAMLLAAGAAVASGGLEVRARTASVLYPFVIYTMLLLILAGAFSMNLEYLQPGTAVLDKKAWGLVGRVFLAFGGAGVFLFLMPQVTGRPRLAFQKGTFLTCVSLLALMLVLVGGYGEGGFKAMEWPAIELMSGVELPGGFLQRWDVVFVGLLLMELFLAAGTSLYYLKLCGSNLRNCAGTPSARRMNRYRCANESNPRNGGGKRQIWLWAALAFLASAACGSYERVVRIYTAVNRWTVAATVLLLLILYGKTRWKR